VFIVGNGTSPMEVYMYDGDGNFAVGKGFGDRKMVDMRVYREGTFRVEVRNLGPATNTFTIYTN